MRRDMSFFPARDFFAFWLPPLLGMTAILALSGDLGSGQHTLGPLNWLLSHLSSLSAIQIKTVHHYLRKAGHVTAYGVLGFLWFRALWGERQVPRWQCCLWSLGLCLLVALMDEGHQAFLRSRSGSVADMALDLSGSTLALGVILSFGFLRLKPPGFPAQVSGLTSGPAQPHRADRKPRHPL